MSIPYLGEICALAAAVNWAFALCLFKLSGESIPPLSLSLFKNTVGLILLALTLPLVGEGFDVVARTDPSDIYILILSGVIGIAIADTILFYSLNIIGVGLLTITECVYTPSVIFVAAVFLSEPMSIYHYVGGALVISGVFVSSTHRPPPGRTRLMLLWGMFLGALAIVMMAVGIVIAKPILEEMPLITAATVRVAGGTVVMAIMMAVSPKRAALFKVFKPSKVWKVCVPASIFGMYFAMLLWVAGFKYTHASIAAILNQTSTVIALIFATFLLKERFTKRKAVAAALALSGVVVTTSWLFDQ